MIKMKNIIEDKFQLSEGIISNILAKLVTAAYSGKINKIYNSVEDTSTRQKIKDLQKVVDDFKIKAKDPKFQETLKKLNIDVDELFGK